MGKNTTLSPVACSAWLGAQNTQPALKRGRQASDVDRGKKSALSPVRSTALLGGGWRLRPSWPMSPLVLLRDDLYHAMVSQHT